MYDYLIVGSGLYAAVFAHEAKKEKKRCLVIERRNHTGGNVYTENIDGINVHKYGAHIFHTDDTEVWNYVNEFSVFNRFTNSPVANYKGQIFNLPFNMNTFNRMWGVITPQEAMKKIEEQKEAALAVMVGIQPSDDEAVITKKISSFSPGNLEEQAISLVGVDIYEKLIKGYTQKQWGRPCTELPAFIIKRLPVRFTYDNNYFNSRYQGIPVNGYNQMIEKLLDGVRVLTDVDYIKERQHLKTTGKLLELEKEVGREGICHVDVKNPTFGLAKKLVYTGPVDEFFDYKFGPLEYRSVRFETEKLDVENYQGNAVVNYTDAETAFTRIIEHKHFQFGKDSDGRDLAGTIISREYPCDWKKGDEPYYPVNDEKNNNLYLKYKALSEKMDNCIFGGRLGEYKYYDMDQVIRKALDAAWNIAH